MKINKIQKEIFATLMSEQKVRGWRISETETAFTNDGLKGFILPNRCIHFNQSEVIMLNEEEKMFQPDKDDKQLIISNDLRIINGNRIARKLICKEEESIRGCEDEPVTEMWVNNKFLDYFTNPTLYAFDSRSRIAVVEPFVSKKICAVLMPIRVY